MLSADGVRKDMNIILLGAPGAKGTQAAIICERLNIPTI